MPVVVGINHFAGDSDAEVEAVKDYVAGQGAEAIPHAIDFSRGQGDRPEGVLPVRPQFPIED